jgi:hypothetical protein
MFVPPGIMHVFRAMFLPVMWLLVLRSVVVSMLLVLPFLALMLIRVLCGRVPMLFLVFVVVVLAGIALPSVVVSVL